MPSPTFSLLARGFIGGAVVTASISYAIIQTHGASSPKESLHTVPADRFPFGRPVDLRQAIDYTGHTVYYDPARKQPLWVAESFTKQSLQGNAVRKDCRFHRDENIPERFSAENADYVSSGWTRGHMAAAGDFKSSQQAMKDSFCLTNIVPQDGENNAGFWNMFERFCRNLTNTFDSVSIITGPLYQANEENGTKSYVQHEVIGNDRVPVPTHLYKLIVGLSNAGESTAVGAFVVPNKPIPNDQVDLTKFQVSKEELEVLTGFTFLPELSSTKSTDLCLTQGTQCKLKNWKDVELHYARKRVANAKSQKDIDEAMAQLKKKNIKVDKNTIKLVESKQVELRNNNTATS